MVSILLADGFEESEALITVDLLRRAGVAVTMTGLSGTQVVGSHGITVLADNLISDLDPDMLNMLILPGGLRGVENISASAQAKALIQTCSSNGAYLAAICAAPTILAKLGLLDGREAVCYPGMENQMCSAVCSGRGPVITDGRFITGEAAGSTFLFALKLVELLKGGETARSIRDEVHYRG